MAKLIIKSDNNTIFKYENILLDNLASKIIKVNNNTKASKGTRYGILYKNPCFSIVPKWISVLRVIKMAETLLKMLYFFIKSFLSNLILTKFFNDIYF